MALGPQRRGAQCICIGCIGLRTALLTHVLGTQTVLSSLRIRNVMYKDFTTCDEICAFNWFLAPALYWLITYFRGYCCCDRKSRAGYA